PGVANYLHHRWLGLTVRPSAGLGLDLGCGDEVVGPLGESQSFGDNERVDANTSHRPVNHLLFGTVREVAATFLGQWSVPLPRQGVRALKQLLEHGRTSKESEMGDGFDSTPKWLCGGQLAETSGFSSLNASWPHNCRRHTRPVMWCTT